MRTNGATPLTVLAGGPRRFAPSPAAQCSLRAPFVRSQLAEVVAS
jgi:hypothetical protein